MAVRPSPKTSCAMPIRGDRSVQFAALGMASQRRVGAHVPGPTEPEGVSTKRDVSWAGMSCRT